MGRLSLLNALGRTVKVNTSGKIHAQWLVWRCTHSKPLPETSSFAMNLFRGKVVLDAVLPFPKALSIERTESLQLILSPFEKFFQSNVNAAKHDAEAKFDPAVTSTVAELGGYGLQVPEEYGGVGLNNTEYARLVSVVGAHDLAFGIHLGAHQSIGYKGILMYGTPSQKAKYLPDLAKGKRIAAYCLTEPGSGSDASSIQMKAELSRDGKHYVLNGTKIWISNGGLADIFTVFARTAVPETDGSVGSKVTAFIVDRSFGGVTHSEPEKKMGIHASNTVSLYFENCKVPVENVLGPVGDGFKVAVNILNQGRFGMAAALSGAMRFAIEKAVQHTTTRKQFGHLLNEYENVQEKLANMIMRQYITESMAFMISGSMDLGAKDFQVEAAISKIYSSEAAWQCMDEAIQIHGGTGYMRETQLERFLRDLRVFRIFEGANDVLRLFVSLTGLNYAGKHLAATSKSPAGMLSVGLGKVQHSLGLPGNGAILPKRLPPQLSASAKLVGAALDDFGAASTDLLIRYKKDIIHDQFRLIRLSDAAIQLYGMMCSLSRVAQAIEQHSATVDHEMHLVNLICRMGCATVHQNLAEIHGSRKDPVFSSIKRISSDLCEHGGVITASPLGF